MRAAQNPTPRGESPILLGQIPEDPCERFTDHPGRAPYSSPWAATAVSPGRAGRSWADRRQHGCCRRAHTDVFTARRSTTYRLVPGGVRAPEATDGAMRGTRATPDHPATGSRQRWQRTSWRASPQGWRYWRRAAPIAAGAPLTTTHPTIPIRVIERSSNVAQRIQPEAEPAARDQESRPTARLQWVTTHFNQAEILSIAEGGKDRAKGSTYIQSNDPGRYIIYRPGSDQMMLVAGAGFEPTTFGL